MKIDFDSKNLKEVLHSGTVKQILVFVGIAVIALLIFQVGVFVGYHKAGSAYRWGDNYYRAFGERRGMPGMGMMDRNFGLKNFPPAHGVDGEILSISLPNILVEGRDEVERTVNIGDKTLIKKMREDIKPADLKVGDFIVVIGSPDSQSVVNAELIRVMPNFDIMQSGSGAIKPNPQN